MLVLGTASFIHQGEKSGVGVSHSGIEHLKKCYYHLKALVVPICRYALLTVPRHRGGILGERRPSKWSLYCASSDAPLDLHRK